MWLQAIGITDQMEVILLQYEPDGFLTTDVMNT